jgi:hypothetical protein
MTGYTRGDLTGRMAEERAAAVKAGTDRTSLDADILAAIRAGLLSYPSGKAEALAALTEFIRDLAKVTV